MNIFTRITISTLSFLTPVLAAAQTSVVGGVGSGGWFFGIGSGSGVGGIGSFTLGCGTNTICVVAGQFIWLINFVLVPLVFAVAFIVFLWGVFRAYIFKRGEEEVANAHQLILWGIVGFVVMLSVWGLVFVVANTFGLAGIGRPPYPASI